MGKDKITVPEIEDDICEGVPLDAEDDEEEADA